MSKTLKRVSLIVILGLVLSLAGVVLPAHEVQAAQLYEHYNTGDDNVWGFYSNWWKAQTFTAESNHMVTSVKLKLWRSGSPGTIIVSIRATNGAGHPTGPDLTSGTTDGNTLTTDAGGEWREIALASHLLISGTKYAIVVRVLGGDLSNRVWWCLDESLPTYAGGNLEHSADSGGNWTSHNDNDFMFEVWGDPPTGDVNGDGRVNVLDMIRIGMHWGETGPPGWIPEDVNQDGVINVLDMILVGMNWTG